MTNLISIESVEGDVKPLEKTLDGIPALSFSGGADSTAALAVMPDSTMPFFMFREIDQNHRSLYRSEAAQKSCAILNNMGYSTQIVISNLEYLRNPIGFPSDLAVGAPLILLSEFFNIRSISFGTVMESAYGTGGKNFRKYSDSSHFRLWNNLFESVGINYSLPCAGVSEVGTSIILQKTSFDRIAQSCIRGEWKKPCLNCWKCFRKELLQFSLFNHSLSVDMIEKMIFNSKETQMKLLNDKPIKHECVLSYALSNIENKNSVFTALSELVRCGKIETSWMEKWYDKSIIHIDEIDQEHICDKLHSILGTMDLEEQKFAEAWENEPNEERQKNWERLHALIN